MNDTIAELNGALLGRYLVKKEIGAGGMATVYLAQDLRHDRRVAIKVLQPELAAIIGAERFLAEIRTTANLQHPHILPLFDSGQAGPSLFYVMPFVDGISLRDRMSREKQLPTVEAVRIATEVAGALDYAHRRSVIHRDIKPENILLQDGSALIADFGIALAASKAGTRMTETGMSLGTPQYMSPEQAMGERELDARSDIYALGCVVYEMLTGEPPFSGPTAQAIVAKVMTTEPTEITSLRKTIPANVSDAVHTALQKLPADRHASAAEFSTALSGTKPSGGVRHTRAHTRPLSRVSRVLPWMVAGTAATGMLALYFSTPTPEAGSSVTFAIEPPAGSSAEQAFGDPAVSPDGQTIAFINRDEGNTELFLRKLDALTSAAVPNSKGAANPIFSPDGQWLAFTVGDKWQRIPLKDGRMEVIGTAGPVSPHVTWTRGDELVYSTGINGRGLMVMPANGSSAPREFTKTDANAHAMPLAMPDGDHVAFIVWGPGFTEDDSLAIGSIRTGQWKTLGIIAVQPVAFTEGWLSYLTADGSMMAVQFDEKSEKVVGAPLRLQGDILGVGLGGGVATISASGTSAFHQGSHQSRLAIADAASWHPVTEEAHGYSNPRFSPDGKALAVAISEQRADLTTSDIWIYGDLSQPPRRLTTEGNFWGPVWMPDGKRVVYRTLYQKHPEILIQPTDGSTPAKVLIQSGADEYILDVSVTPDGLGLVYCSQNPVNADITLKFLSLAQNAMPEPLIAKEKFYSCQGRVSPDGRWLVFTTWEDEKPRVMLQPFRLQGGMLQVSLASGIDPQWQGANVISYIDGAGVLIRATVSLSPGQLAVTHRQPVVPNLRAQVSDGSSSMYDIAASGRVVMVKTTDARRRLVVTTNWLGLLKRRVAENASKP